MSSHVDNRNPICIAVHDAGEPVEVDRWNARSRVVARVYARRAPIEVEVAARRVDEHRRGVDVAGPGIKGSLYATVADVCGAGVVDYLVRGIVP